MQPTKKSLYLWLFALLILIIPTHSNAAQYLIDFDDLAEGYAFSESRQAYADLDGGGQGITIGGPGIERVVIPDDGAHSPPHALFNERGISEFGSEGESIEIHLNGFTSHYCRVFVGLPVRAINRVTAHLYAFRSGLSTPVDDDEVILGYGPGLLEHELVVEDAAEGSINRLIISYGYDDDPDYTGTSEDDAFESELIDSLLIRVWEGSPPKPPEDETPPEVHILAPEDNETVSGGSIIGYVVEDGELTSLNASTLVGSANLLPGATFSIREGEPRYYFARDIPVRTGFNTLRVRAENAAGLADTALIHDVIVDPPDYPPPPPEYPETLDFEATGMEVTQVIQSWDMIDSSIYAGTQDVLLVEGKRTLVRVYGEVTGTPDPIDNVTCRLRAYRGGTELPDSPIYSMNRVTLVPGENHFDQRPDAAKSFNFILPPEWTEAGTVRFVATVNPGGIPETHYNVENDAVRDISFRETETMHILVYPIRSSSEGDVIPTWNECVENISRTRQIFPVSTDKIHVEYARDFSTDEVLSTGDKYAWYGLLRRFRRYLGFRYGMAYALPYDNAVYLGLLDDTISPSSGVSGISSSIFPVCLSTAPTDDYDMVTGHEIGHTRGLGHVIGCGSPAPPYESYPAHRDPDGTLYSRASIGDWGVDIQGSNSFTLIDPSDYNDMMSYCWDGWLSPHTWERLRLGFAASSLSEVPENELAVSAVKKPAPYFHIGGVLKPTGELILDGVWQSTRASGSSDHAGTGLYSIKLLTSKNSVLFQRFFKPSPIADLEDYKEFFEIVPAKSNTAIVKIDGPYITKPVTIKAGTSVPEVTVVYPNGGEKWPANGETKIAWRADDADGDSLQFTVLFSNDNGGTWRVVEPELKKRGMTVDLGDLPGGKNSCMIRVLASDGINQGQDQSDGSFTKGGLPPRVNIDRPSRSAVFSQGDRVIFEGLVSDMEDGAVSAENITWSSDKDGSLGSGLILGTRDLSRGMHLITLKAVDSHSMSALDTIPVFIKRPGVFPDVKVNDMEGPVAIPSGGNLTIKLAMNSGSIPGYDADWWFVIFHFSGKSASLKADWKILSFWTIRYPLFDFAPIKVLDQEGVDDGEYIIAFGVDTKMNGRLDPSELSLDSVQVHVGP